MLKYLTSPWCSLSLGVCLQMLYYPARWLHWVWELLFLYTVACPATFGAGVVFPLGVSWLGCYLLLVCLMLIPVHLSVGWQRRCSDIFVSFLALFIVSFERWVNVVYLYAPVVGWFLRVPGFQEFSSGFELSLVGPGCWVSQLKVWLCLSR